MIVHWSLKQVHAKSQKMGQSYHQGEVTVKGICVGMGSRGKSWYRWAQQAGLEILGVVDINREILDKACDELGIPEPMRFERIARAVEVTGAEVATVCAANPAHATCLHECLDAGVHVMIEKPMVESLLFSHFKMIERSVDSAPSIEPIRRRYFNRSVSTRSPVSVAGISRRDCEEYTRNSSATTL